MKQAISKKDFRNIEDMLLNRVMQLHDDLSKFPM